MGNGRRLWSCGRTNDFPRVKKGDGYRVQKQLKSHGKYLDRTPVTVNFPHYYLSSLGSEVDVLGRPVRPRRPEGPGVRTG